MLKPLLPEVREPRTKLSMGEHCELMVKEWQISRLAQDELALRSHQNAVDFVHGAGLLMAPTIAVNRLLARNKLNLQDFDYYEIHEAVAPAMSMRCS